MYKTFTYVITFVKPPSIKEFFRKRKENYNKTNNLSIISVRTNIPYLVQTED